MVVFAGVILKYQADLTKFGLVQSISDAGLTGYILSKVVST